MDRRFIGIGDIHGEVSKLKRLIEIILDSFKNDLPTIVFLDDYINRGESSLKVLDFLIKLEKEESLGCIFLRGNHEEVLLEAYEGSFSTNLNQNVWGRYFEEFKNYKGEILISKKHISFLKRTKLFYKTEDLLFVHGGIDGVGQISCWEYGVVGNLPEGIRRVIRGHAIHEEVSFYKNNIAIDTGAYERGGALSAICIPSLKVLEVT